MLHNSIQLYGLSKVASPRLAFDWLLSEEKEMLQEGTRGYP